MNGLSSARQCATTQHLETRARLCEALTDYLDTLDERDDLQVTGWVARLLLARLRRPVLVTLDATPQRSRRTA